MMFSLFLEILLCFGRCSKGGRVIQVGASQCFATVGSVDLSFTKTKYVCSAFCGASALRTLFGRWDARVCGTSCCDKAHNLLGCNLMMGVSL